MKFLSTLDVPRRLILSAGLPTFVVLCLLQVQWRTNMLTRTTENGATTSWDVALLRDQAWFWPGVVLLVTGMLWCLWSPGRRA